MEKKCSNCGSLFECEEDEQSCWCSSFPKFSRGELKKEMDCMCKKCLKQMYFDRLFRS